MNPEKINKIFKYIFLISFVAFLALYFSLNAGYFEYKNKTKTVLTEKQIKQFEQDVKEGKNVDIKKYIDTNTKDYQNTISKAGLSLSNTTEKYVNKFIDGSFKVLAKLVGE